MSDNLEVAQLRIRVSDLEDDIAELRKKLDDHYRTVGLHSDKC